MKKSNSAISILHKIRKSLAEKQSFNKFTTTIMLGLLVLDAIILQFLEGNKLTFFAIIGVLLLFAWLVLSLIQSIRLSEDIQNIDDFYLELEKKIEDEKKE